MATVVAFNGPPGAGKTTLADALARLYPGAIRLDFKRPLLALARLRAQQLAGRHLSAAEWAALQSRAQKDAPQLLLQGRTPRGLMIEVSEGVMKREFGPEVFARLFAEGGRVLAEQQDAGALIIADDAGFAEELRVVAGEPWVGRLLLVKVERAGAAWDGDSRRALAWREEVAVCNSGSVAAGVELVVAALHSVARENESRRL